MTQPNVLLIQADQWPWFCLGAAGSLNVRTPNLDALAANGALFDNNTAQSPICLPSRVSMLSGCYVGTTRQPGFSGYCRRGLPFMPRFFKEHGYRTGAFGKFHAHSIGIEEWCFDVSMPTLGEEEDLARPKGAHYRAYCGQVGVKWPTDQMHGHDPFNGVNMYENGKVGRVSSHADPHSRPIEQWAAPSDVPVEHSLETWTTQRCIDFINTREPGDRPFFAWVSYDRPHYPTTLPPEWQGRVRPEDIILSELPSRDDLASMPMALFSHYATRGTSGASIFDLGEERFRRLLSTYFSLIEWIDSEIGRLIGALEENGERESTVIVFTTDHGDMAGMNGLYDKCSHLQLEAITRIPLVIVPPGARQGGAVVDAPVENIDIFPTLASICGLRPPAGIEGRDLSPVVTGREEPDRHRPVFCEDYWRSMVKQDGWRLVFDWEVDDACLLHDLSADPRQWVNLHADERCRGRRLHLKQALLAFVCQRLNGGYTAFDVERMRKGLDNDGTFLPPYNDSKGRGLRLHHYRSALLIDDREANPSVPCKLLVPFFPDESLLLWNGEGPQHENQYLTRARSLPLDTGIAERLIDRALRKLMGQFASVSHHTTPAPDRGDRPDERTVCGLLSARA